ncbi:MATE family efflux transporter [Campylobacter sp. RM13119]|uniref:MATE family efflux transporter n=1 Tax=Campylobacter californiensis TaxID=1032243 RepID=UPI00147456EE|nr:MATE family efflux transporter [Campylobacter sp. RM13119]MBE3606594.1 MATE family efflux transporter [Campylobacter sp. RM13119]
MNLTKDPINKLIVSLATPAALAMLFNTIYNATGTFFAAKISTSATAGLSMSFLLYLSVVGMGLGFGSALSALIGNALGANKLFLAKIYAQKGAVFVLIFAIFMGSLGYAVAPKFLVFLGANEEFLTEALEYIRVIFVASPFFLSIKAFNGILIALGDTKSLRNWLFFGVFINIGLCFIFVKMLNLGVASIAFSTAFVQFMGCIFLFKKTYKSGMINFENMRNFLPDIRIYKKILNQAFPACLNYLSMSLGGLVLLKFISYYGTDAVAGYGVALRIEQLTTLPTIGIAAAVLSIVSRNHGARKHDRVLLCYKNAIKILLLLCVFAAMFLIFVAPRVISFFDINDSATAIAKGYLLISAFSFLGYGVMNISGSVLQAVKKPKMVFVLNATRQLILQSVAYSTVIYVLKGTIEHIWIAMFINVYFTALCFACVSVYVLKRKMKGDGY